MLRSPLGHDKHHRHELSKADGAVPVFVVNVENSPLDLAKVLGRITLPGNAPEVLATDDTLGVFGYEVVKVIAQHFTILELGVGCQIVQLSSAQGNFPVRVLTSEKARCHNFNGNAI